jgi:hypothetical protein
MTRRGAVIVGVALLIGAACIPVAIASVGGSGAAQISEFSTRSVSGVAIPFGADEEQQRLERMESILDGTGVSVPDHVMYFVDEQDNTYVLLTNREPVVASVSGSVTVVEDSDSDSAGIMVDDSLSYDQNGRRVSYDQLASNPERYKYQLVRVDGTTRSISYTVDPASNQYVIQRSVATLAEPGGPTYTLGTPGRNGQWAALNLSDPSYGRQRITEVSSKTAQLRTDVIGTTRQDRKWWKTGNVTVNIVVTSAGENISTAVFGRTTPIATDVNDLSQARDHHGEIVTVTTSGVGARMSTQETLLEAKQCAPSSVSNPVTGCMPVPADAVVHGGVLVDGEGKPMVYAGVSNQIQSNPTEPEIGEYRVTGRVVSANQIDPRLSGTALIVYDRERVDGFAAGGDARAEAADRAEAIEAKLRDQQTATAGEWTQLQEATRRTATPTATATATPTSTLTPSGSTPIQETTTAPAYQSNRQDSGILDTLSSGLALLSGVIGIILLISGITISGLNLVARVTDLSFAASVKEIKIVWLSGIGLAVSATLLYPKTRLESLVLLLLGGVIVVLVYGWYWAISNLFE